MDRFPLARDLPPAARAPVSADPCLLGMRERGQDDGVDQMLRLVKDHGLTVSTTAQATDWFAGDGSRVRPRDTTPVRGLSDGFFVHLPAMVEVQQFDTFIKDLGPATASTVVRAQRDHARPGDSVATVSAYAAADGGSYLVWRWSDDIEGPDRPGARVLPSKLPFNEKGAWVVYRDTPTTSANDIPDLSRRIVMSDETSRLLLPASQRDAIERMRAAQAKREHDTYEHQLSTMLPKKIPEHVPTPASIKDLAASMRGWGIPGELSMSVFTHEGYWFVPPEIFTRKQDGAAWQAKWNTFTLALGKVERSQSEPGCTTTWYTNGYRIEAFDDGTKQVGAYRFSNPRPTI